MNQNESERIEMDCDTTEHENFGLLSKRMREMHTNVDWGAFETMALKKQSKNKKKKKKRGGSRVNSRTASLFDQQTAAKR